MLQSFTIATFAHHIGEAFRVYFDPEVPVDVELIAVADLGSDRQDASGHRRPFSLEFRGPTEQAFPQRIYRIEHPALSSFELFLVPIGPDERGMCYEAVFT